MVGDPRIAHDCIVRCRFPLKAHSRISIDVAGTAASAALSITSTSIRVILNRENRTGVELKDWDRAVPAEGIDLGVWMEAQADPEVSSVGPDFLVVDFPCWERNDQDTAGRPKPAPYRGRLRFDDYFAYRIVDGELGPYRWTGVKHDNPHCFFEVRLSDFDMKHKMTRDASWLPSVRETHDPHGWFARLDAWKPDDDPPPPVHPVGAQHYVVVGHDSYIEVLCSSYEFQRVLRSGT